MLFSNLLPPLPVELDVRWRVMAFCDEGGGRGRKEVEFGMGCTPPSGQRGKCRLAGLSEQLRLENRPFLSYPNLSVRPHIP